VTEKAGTRGRGAGRGTSPRHARRRHVWLGGRALVAALTGATALGMGTGVGTAGAAPAAEPQAPVVVAIDAGHGGTNLGAPGPARGVFEKTVTLALARRVRELLLKDAAAERVGSTGASATGAVPLGSTAPSPSVPGLTVVLCRDSDTLVPIRARSRCAAESGARLFLSLHANAVPAGVAPGTRHGFEVFVLGPGEVDDDAALASLANSNPADAAWAAHEVRAAAEQSVELARVVAAHLGRVVEPAVRNAIRQSGASLDVLRGTGTAAVLVEVGFMDHPEEGRRLGDPSGREPIARALADAVHHYLGAGGRGVAIADTEHPVRQGGAGR